MRLIRSRAREFAVDADRLAVLGFSAGGHLAATLATAFSSRAYDPVDAADTISDRPFAAGLIYPVVAMDPPFTHAESRARLLGPDPTPAEVAARSPLRHVGPDTPPMFLAHAMDDDAVPVDNSLLLMTALREAKRPVEAHLFQEGRHAFGVGRPGTPSALWPDLFHRWLARRADVSPSAA
jgi:dipeptidyl aminopeptidase/acylaminoacyl peptidase